MPAYKNKATDTWFVKFYSKDWKGENRQVKRRGFKTKKKLLILREISKCGRNVIWIWNLENFFNCIQRTCRAD